MIQLIIPDISHELQWKEIMTEWNDGEKRPTIFFQDSFDSFLRKMTKIKNHDDVESQVPQSRLYFLLDDTGKIVWFFWFRYHMNFHDDAKYSGNIGYGIRPSERSKWYAKIWLKLLLCEIQKIGYEEVMIACHDDNIPSYKVIEANGWVLKETVMPPDGRPRRRYRISIL